MAPLDRRVDVLVAIGTAADHRQARLLAVCKAALRLVRPLHRRARAVALRQAEIVAHADLVAVADDRRPRQGEQQAVGEFEPPLIAVEHRREAAADAAVVELHLLLWSKGGEHNLPFFLGQARDRARRDCAGKDPIALSPGAAWSPSAPSPTGAYRPRRARRTNAG